MVLGFLSIYFEHFVWDEIKTAITKETKNQFTSITKVKESTIKTFYLIAAKNDPETRS